MQHHKQQSFNATFGISVFQCPEQMIAINLSLFDEAEKSTNYLNKILKRTKSPPISILYTFQFLKSTEQAETQLSIIRFISQLSDLSVGKSMQSSLSYLQNGSFLTELRHNLTHRVMLKGIVIQKGRQMILKELSQKYWDQMCQKIWNFYVINNEKVEEYYRKIYKKQVNRLSQIKNKLYFRYLDSLQMQHKNTQNPQFLQELSNYKYKQTIQVFLKSIMKGLSQTQKSPQQYFPKNPLKVTIFVCVMIDLTLQLRSKKSFECLERLFTYLKRNKIQIWKEQLIFKKLRKLYFFNYLSEFKNIIKVLPETVKDQIIKFWKQKGQKLKKKVLFQPLQIQ